MRALWLIFIAFLLRLILATTVFNNDVLNHEVWTNFATSYGWLGIYSRDMAPYAQVNYPPLTLYSFKWGHDLYSHFPALTIPEWKAFFYKLPTLLADLGIALLILFYSPFSHRLRLTLSLFFLFNPSLIYNSVFWGQVESWVTFWCVLTGILLVKGRGELAVITYTLALLSKQNAAPLAPLVLYGLYLSKPHLGKLASALMLSLGLIYLAYAPMLGSTSLLGIGSTYFYSLAGQSHQHLGSVNALNLWYLLGFNQVSDASIRLWSLFATVIITLYSLWNYYKFRKNHYYAFFSSASLIYLGIFLFTTRMHERHLYMALAFMTFLLPTPRILFSYLTLSVLSFYNQYIVWAEYMAVAPVKENLWLLWTKTLSLISVIVGLKSALLISRLAKSKTSGYGSRRGAGLICLALSTSWLVRLG